MMGSPTQANAVLVLGRAEACVAFYCAKRNLCDRIAERDFPFYDIFIAVVCNSFFVNYVG